MVDVANVGFVDAHPKSDRGDDDFVFSVHEPLLNLRPVFGLHSSVVGLGIESRLLTGGGDFFGRLLQRHINNCGARWAALKTVDQHFHAFGRSDDA